MKPIHITAIVATHNRPNLLSQRALDSVVHQIRLPDCLVVVDDSSAEVRPRNQSYVEALSLSPCDVRYLTNQRTQGASGAWNTAVEFLARQQSDKEEVSYLAFLDDDDAWHPQYLERCYQAITHHSAEMVATGFYRRERSGVPLQVYAPPDHLKEDLFLRGNPGIQGSNLFLSLERMLQVGGFDENLPSCTDRDLCLRLCDLGDLAYSPIREPLLTHYADPVRPRLSTPRSAAKEEGLTAFWQKYRGRMDNEQQAAFLQRALQLFDWQPPPSYAPAPRPPVRLGLTLGVCCNPSSTDSIGWILEEILRLGAQQLVGFNVVLAAAETSDNSPQLETLLKRLDQRGLTHYNLRERSHQLDLATLWVAKRHTGHQAWVLHTTPTAPHSSAKPGEDLVQFLQRLGASSLPADAESIPLGPELRQITDELQEFLRSSRVSSAQARIKRLFGASSLTLLGVGSEAIVLTDGEKVFKCIDYWKTRTPDEQLTFLRERGPGWKDLPGLYPLEGLLIDGFAVVLTYKFEPSVPYTGGHTEHIITLLHSCSQAGIVCNNIHPKNLVKTASEVKLIDYGSDIKPWSEFGFEHMARRAFLSIHHPAHPRLKQLMRDALRTTEMKEMEGYPLFRQRLVGLDRNLKAEQERRLPLLRPGEQPQPYELVIGVISGDAHKLLPLLHSIAAFASAPFLRRVQTLVLCNGLSQEGCERAIAQSHRPVGEVVFLTEAQQRVDAEQLLFGPELMCRPPGVLGIAQARSMLQKYVGLACEQRPGSYAWILDDDMRLDARTRQYLEWLPAFKEADVDILVGQYEGSSPNPPLNGLRVQLVDLWHNLRWLEGLLPHATLPDRSEENQALRERFSDYYYDLSRKHTAHLESPFWLEPVYSGETVAEARARLIAFAPSLVTGYPLTRGIKPSCPVDPILAARPTVNRGGTTFVLTPQALTDTPNLIPRIQGREARRSDMTWAIINQCSRGMTIQGVPFPIVHEGRVEPKPAFDPNKVQDEILGSALYAGIQEFLRAHPEHKLQFSDSECQQVWLAVKRARDSRMARLRHTIFRIIGLTKALAAYPELQPLTDHLTTTIHIKTWETMAAAVHKMGQRDVVSFLEQLVPQSERFANSHSLKKET